MNSRKLSPEDQERVEHFLTTGLNARERKPFRPWILLGIIWAFMFAFSGISYLIAHLHGAV